MLLEGLAEDDDVVHVHDASIPGEAGENTIHKALEGGRRVCEAVRHHFELV